MKNGTNLEEIEKISIKNYYSQFYTLLFNSKERNEQLKMIVDGSNVYDWHGNFRMTWILCLSPYLYRQTQILCTNNLLLLLLFDEPTT